METNFLLQDISPKELEKLIAVEHSDPHSILGAHPCTVSGKSGVVIRAFHPDAVRAEVSVQGRQALVMEKCHPGGLFATFIPRRRLPLSLPLSIIFVTFELVSISQEAGSGL